ncbi:branched-chain amino acid ABC transporter permease (plasmid) [Thioclava sp. 'Guangxiensis']|uniref:branched-chain amino acid ABC transporter permease n=1 Tax=Thioclava sp. 'Guangxiensis' TaxID=3149044 RepID=UPI0032C45734
MAQTDMKSFLRSQWTPIVLIGALAIVTAIVSLVAGLAVQTFWTEILIRIILVTGFYIFIGNSGIFAFGHAAFACIGGYVAAWLSMDMMFKQIMLSGLPVWVQNTQLMPWIAALAGFLVSGVIAGIIGAVIVRLSDIAASIATFAFLLVVNRIFSNWDSVTGGVAPLTNIPQLGGSWMNFLFMAGALLIAWVFQNSRIGLMLRASRDDEVAALASGISVYRMRLTAFAISGAVMGCGGAIYSFFLGILTVDVFYMSLTFLLLVMLVVGGAGSLTGVVVGVVLVSCVSEVLRMAEEGVALGGHQIALPLGMQQIVLGIFMIFVLINRADGLTGGRELKWPGRARKSGAAALERTEQPS